MKTALLITTNDEVKEIEFENSLEFYYKQLDCDVITLTTLRTLHEIAGLSKDFVMIVDEEALMKDEPKFNIYASAFRGTSIYGNAMIVKDNGEDFEGLEKEDHEQLSRAIRTLLDKLEKQYRN